MLNKNSRLFVLLLLLFSMVLVACGSGAGEEPAAGGEEAAGSEESAAEEEVVPEEDVVEEEVAGDCTSDEVFCVGLVTDVGEIDDKSFNQSAWEGVQRAESELGAKVDYIETSDAKDYAANIGLFADEGYDVIVTVGFALGQATVEAAGTYPDIHFIGVDQFQAETVDNVAGIIFPEDQSGFMAGALAGMLSESGTVAAVLGTDLVPPVVAFKEGYENGALYINPDINLISTYHPGGLDVAFTDPEWGASTAKQAIDQGADVVFGAGGKTGNGALIEVAGNEGLYCIGVDSDQWETVPEAHSCLVSSAMKLITPGVFDVIQSVQDGSFAAGNFVGDVGLAPFHDFDSGISDEIKGRLDEIRAGLLDGSIATGYSP
jgi:basic membrane protein A